MCNGSTDLYCDRYTNHPKIRHIRVYCKRYVSTNDQQRPLTHVITLILCKYNHHTACTTRNTRYFDISCVIFGQKSQSSVEVPVVPLNNHIVPLYLYRSVVISYRSVEIFEFKTLPLSMFTVVGNTVQQVGTDKLGTAGT